MMTDVALRGSEGKGNSPFMRHVLACGNAVLPGDRLPFLVASNRVGYVTRAFADALAEEPEVERIPGGIRVRDPNTLGDLARKTADRGLHRWRNEPFDVRERVGGEVLTQIDRGALPTFGIESVGAHINGIVEKADGPLVWVAHRSPLKALDPNKLDNLVAGGVSAGLTPEATILKEAQEEASIPADLSRQARPVGRIRYAMERFEGLRRDTLFCYDLILPDDFQPVPGDDEVISFELWPLDRVAKTIAAGDDFKFNVNLVLIDLLIRRGVIVGEEAEALRAALERNAGAP